MTFSASRKEDAGHGTGSAKRFIVRLCQPRVRHANAVRLVECVWLKTNFAKCRGRRPTGCSCVTRPSASMLSVSLRRGWECTRCDRSLAADVNRSNSSATSMNTALQYSLRLNACAYSFLPQTALPLSSRRLRTYTMLMTTR